MAKLVICSSSSKLTTFARTSGAKDKRPRKKRGAVPVKPNKQSRADQAFQGARKVELQTRSLANLGRGLNSVSNAIEQARATAKYLGINPSNRGVSVSDHARLLNTGALAGNRIFDLGRKVITTGKVQQGLSHAKVVSHKIGGLPRILGRILL